MKANAILIITSFLFVACTTETKTESKEVNNKGVTAETSDSVEIKSIAIDEVQAEKQIAKETPEAEAEPEKGRKKKRFLKIAPPVDFKSPPDNAETSESGLRSITLKKSSKRTSPTDENWVEVHYTGWDSQGKAFISTAPSKRSRTLPLRGFPKGLQEGLRSMKVDEKRRIWVPENLAPKGQVSESGTVVYDVELVSIKKEPPAPKHLTPPPKASKTESGLSYRIIGKSKSRRAKRPDDNSMLSVNITQWNANGRLIMSTVLQGRPMNFNLGHKSFPPPLWREAAKLLKKGEKGRFWIPVENTSRNRKMGNTIMDMEILSIKESPKPKVPVKKR